MYQFKCLHFNPQKYAWHLTLPTQMNESLHTSVGATVILSRCTEKNPEKQHRES